MHDGIGFGFGGFMWIFWILLIVAAIWLIKITLPGDSGRNTRDSDSPLEILQKRYARGEIDEEEYQRRRRELENQG